MPRDVTANTLGAAPQAAKPRGRWIPWMFVLGFCVMLGANGALIYNALSTFPGLVVEKSYEQGVSYNRFIEAKEKELALGWWVDPAFTVVDAATRRVRFDLTPRGPDGAALDGAVVSGELSRPLEQIPPLAAPFTDFGGGRWIADVELPLPGQWELRMTVVRGADRLHVTKRYVVK